MILPASQHRYPRAKLLPKIRERGYMVNIMQNLHKWQANSQWRFCGCSQFSHTWKPSSRRTREKFLLGWLPEQHRSSVQVKRSVVLLHLLREPLHARVLRGNWLVYVRDDIQIINVLIAEYSSTEADSGRMLPPQSAPATLLAISGWILHVCT